MVGVFKKVLHTETCSDKNKCNLEKRKATESTRTVTHKSTVARTVMCRQDGRGRFPVLLDDLSKCRTNSQRKSQLS